MKILIVEDEKNVRMELVLLLENAMYEVVAIEDFNQVSQQILAAAPDLVLLDLNLPGTNGQGICQELRQKSDVPIIFLTSDNNVLTELNSLLMGGDDFISKPYLPSLLLARIQNLLKRQTAMPTNEKTQLVHNEVALNLNTYKVSYKEQEVELTKNECKLLHYFFQRKGEVIPRIDIIDYLWENDVFIDDNVLSVNVTRLRNKLADLGITDFIQTKRGVGYQI
ncbi:two-component system response regulator protein BraR/BceR [Enterococcus sp. PF1-24]|uniref:response regulator transcription factor n=1 Tax=unclassified Enterococcus TaxID=2608891 RepID=UPI002474F5D6|nr:MULTISPECIES: response regulator transcription factor [unclassified Enterococcus]MDH6364173.1 two-component system response regulator protein BraR/BceR [Enterococcus sp. PFB1-1]MDH6401274.1 two-component system response regulator protein BraR/BceR [Enterococcus sp. PF1-24]